MSRSRKNIFPLPVVCPVFDSAAPAQTSETSSRSQGGVVLWCGAAAAERALQRAMAHCSLRIHMKYPHANGCERNSLNRVFVFEFVDGVRFGAPPKDSAQRGLSYFGIFDKQDSYQIKPQQAHWYEFTGQQLAQESGSMHFTLGAGDTKLADRVVFIHILINSPWVQLRLKVIGGPAYLLIGRKTLSLLQAGIDTPNCQGPFSDIWQRMFYAV